MLICMSWAFQTYCSESDGQSRQLPDLSASEMFLSNILYSVSYAFTHNNYSRHIDISEHTLPHFLPEYPEVRRVQCAYLNLLDGFARMFYSAFLPFICLCTS